VTCKLVFQTQRRLYQHERVTHPSHRNEKRKPTGQQDAQPTTAKGYGKVWAKAEIDLMLQLELRFKGHPMIAKEMVSHFPGKTLKQIRDKRREAAYRKLLQSLSESTTTLLGTPMEDTQEDVLTPSLTNEPGTMTSSPQSETGLPEMDLAEETTITTDLPKTGTIKPIYETDRDKTWILNTIDQALETAPTDHTMLEEFQPIYDRLISILKETGTSPGQSGAWTPLYGPMSRNSFTSHPVLPTA